MSKLIKQPFTKVHKIDSKIGVLEIHDEKNLQYRSCSLKKDINTYSKINTLFIYCSLKEDMNKSESFEENSRSSVINLITFFLF